MPARAIDQHTRERARVLYRAGRIVREIASELGVSGAFVSGLATDEDREVRAQALSGGGAARAGSTPVSSASSRRTEPCLPEPAPEAGGPSLPEPWPMERKPFSTELPGWWLVLGDLHIPMHDKSTVVAAVEEARSKNAVGVLLNGDVMDMFGISPFFRVPTERKFKEEIEAGRQFLAWLRSRLPGARIVYREGNHEFRFTRYVADRAAALWDLEELTLHELLRLKSNGVEWVQDKRKVMLGKLTTLHGHELRKGEGVNPARLAFLRTTCTVLVGHHHRTSEHHQRALDDKHFAAWSVGCACYVSCDYDPYNQWNHGYAMVRVEPDGSFSVQNRRVINGQAY